MTAESPCLSQTTVTREDHDDGRVRQPGWWERRVRFVTARNADAHQQRMDQLRSDRAAAAPLRVAFPAVQQLRVELKFAGRYANPPGSQSFVLHPPARAFFTYPCPYANCDGQFDLNRAVNAALDGPSLRTEGILECAGRRAQKHDSRHPCQLRLLYTIIATRPERETRPTCSGGKSRPD